MVEIKCENSHKQYLARWHSENTEKNLFLWMGTSPNKPQYTYQAVIKNEMAIILIFSPGFYLHDFMSWYFKCQPFAFISFVSGKDNFSFHAISCIKSLHLKCIFLQIKIIISQKLPLYLWQALLAANSDSLSKYENIL